MRISVLIPCKNPDQGLFKTLNSLKGIDLIKEILIVNDYSTKGLEFFEKAKLFNKVKLIKNSQSKGISGALNTGIANISNELISRIDSGDSCINKKRYELILKEFLKNESLDMICSGLITPNGKKIKPMIKIFNGVISPYSRVPHPTWVIKKKSIIYNYRENKKRFEDYVFLVENNFKILPMNEYDIEYDNSDKLNGYREFIIGINKGLYFIRNSKKLSFSILIGLSYILMRTLRLILTRRKVI